MQAFKTWKYGVVYLQSLESLGLNHAERLAIKGTWAMLHYLYIIMIYFLVLPSLLILYIKSCVFPQNFENVETIMTDMVTSIISSVGAVQIIQRNRKRGGGLLK